MSETRLQDYRDKLTSLKSKITHDESDKDLLNKEETLSFLQEISDTIKITSQTNDLVQIDSVDDDEVIDYECLPDKIDEFSEMLKSLVSIYLKQESLDQFLRIVINNDQSILSIDNEQNIQYRNLENQVLILKEDNVDLRLDEINKLREQINNVSEDILDNESRLDELQRGMEANLDDCYELLNELDEGTRIESQQVSQLRNKELNEIEEYQTFIKTWKDVKRLRQDKDIVDREVKRMKLETNTNHSDKNFDNNNDNLKKIEIENTVMNKLISLQETHFLSQFDHISQIKFTYKKDIKSLNFKIKGKYDIQLNLNVWDNSFENVEILKGNNDRILKLEKDINSKFYHNDNIFHIINYIRNIIMNEE